MAESNAATPVLDAPSRTIALEVAVPLRVSHKWVAYACRTAGVGKPKWNAVREVWNATCRADDGVDERIAITGSGELAVQVKVAWMSSPGSPAWERETETGRRILTAIVMAMQAEVRRRSSGRMPVAVHYR